mmetsp:Transcript_49096/g.141147  ORF Transcript_49096/g.141147 Transcript_49096/m.141147 type:complete len:254 (-) Transcript_49096:1107-1868(-)
MVAAACGLPKYQVPTEGLSLKLTSAVAATPPERGGLALELASSAGLAPASPPERTPMEGLAVELASAAAAAPALAAPTARVVMELASAAAAAPAPAAPERVAVELASAAAAAPAPAAPNERVPAEGLAVELASAAAAAGESAAIRGILVPPEDLIVEPVPAAAAAIEVCASAATRGLPKYQVPTEGLIMKLGAAAEEAGVRGATWVRRARFSCRKAATSCSVRSRSSQSAAIKSWKRFGISPERLGVMAAVSM